MLYVQLIIRSTQAKHVKKRYGRVVKWSREGGEEKGQDRRLQKLSSRGPDHCCHPFTSPLPMTTGNDDVGG